MYYEDNDTMSAEEQMVNQQKEKKSKKKDMMVAKLLGSATLGLVAGAGAVYAADHMGKTENPEEIKPIDQTEESQTVNDEVQTPEQDGPTVDERLAQLEEQERIRQEQEQQRQEQEQQRERHESQRVRNEDARQALKQDVKHEEISVVGPEVKQDDDDISQKNILSGREVVIDSVEEDTMVDGRTIHVFSGTVDGHDAVFADDGKGNIVCAIIDENDNGDLDREELLDLTSTGMTAQDLGYKEIPVNHDIEVISVDHDVEMMGETVDVAILSVDDEPVFLVDVDQDKLVDIAIVDKNGNGELDEEDIQDVSSHHIAMPTDADIDGYEPDCTSDDQVGDTNMEMYEV